MARKPKVTIRIAPYGKWRKLIRDLNKSQTILEGRKTERAMEDLAETAKNLIIDGIQGGREGWDENSEFTKAVKGSEKQLVDSGTFIRSIDTWQDGKRWYAGIKPGTRAENGADLSHHVRGLRPQQPSLRPILRMNLLRGLKSFWKTLANADS
jgi:hypothetical protein